MARVIVPASFGAELEEKVRTERLRGRIISAIQLLEMFPRLGSCDVPKSVRERYGEVRKLVVSPFDIAYVYDELEDTVTIRTIYALSSARRGLRVFDCRSPRI